MNSEMGAPTARQNRRSTATGHRITKHAAQRTVVDDHRTAHSPIDKQLQHLADGHRGTDCQRPLGNSEPIRSLTMLYSIAVAGRGLLRNASG